jgi:ornithine cyclodeaminase/alanine dehydrogenase-like protein (mu-crystallin family)
MRDCLAALEEVFLRWGQGKAVNQSRQRMRMPGGALQMMVAVDDEAGAGFKTSGGLVGTIVHLYDSKSGEFLAMIEANGLGATRTGAASGVATKYMARPESATVGIIGAGRQAATQLEAVCAVRDIRSVKVYGRRADNRARFAEQMEQRLGVPVTPVATPRECVEASDVVITITNSAEPVLEGRWLAPGTHVNAAGNNNWQHREVDESTIARSGIVAVDDLEQAKIECGELMSAVARGVFRWEQAREIRQVVAGLAPGRTSPEQITLFESQGIAIEDIAAAWRVYHLAKERGMGKPFP